MSYLRARHAAALGLLAGAAVVVQACGGPSLPALTNPDEIITAALKSTESARTVHLELTLDGSINVDLTGTGRKAANLPLAGTTASADVDMAGGKAHATFAVPAFLNLNGDLIQIGETSYVKTSLGGPLYATQPLSGSLPVDPTNASGIIDNVGDFLLDKGVSRVKGDDVDCGGRQCYTVAVELTAEQLAALGLDRLAAGSLPIDLGAASLALTVRVEKDTYHLAGVKGTVSLGDQGSLTFDLALSRWDQPMDISPPPPDQLKPAA